MIGLKIAILIRINIYFFDSKTFSKKIGVTEIILNLKLYQNLSVFMKNYFIMY